MIIEHNICNSGGLNDREWHKVETQVSALQGEIVATIDGVTQKFKMESSFNVNKTPQQVKIYLGSK